MKKLLALVLALMLLMASAAFAETANTITFSNANLLVTAENGSQTVDLSDLTATLAMGNPEGVPTIQLDVAGGGDALLCAVIQFIDGNMVLNLDGMSRPLAASMQNAQAQEGMEQIFANLDSVNGVKLPAFEGVTIPKVPLNAVLDILPMLGVEPQTDGSATTFEIPAQLVTGLLQMILAQIPAEMKAQLGGLDQLLASTQFAVVGRLNDDGETAELLLDLVPVTDGMQDDTPFAGLYFSSKENLDSLEVLVYQDGQGITLAQLDLESKPESAELNLALDVMGQINLTFSLYPQNGDQVAAVALNAAGETFNASLTYGENGDEEYAQFAFEVPNQNVSASVDINEHPAADGSKEGALAVNVASAGQTINLTADLAESKDDVDFHAITNADQAYDAAAMTAADNQALTEDLNNVLANLTSYLNSIQAQPAA